VKETFRVVIVASLLLAAALPLHGQLPKGLVQNARPAAGKSGTVEKR